MTDLNGTFFNNETLRRFEMTLQNAFVHVAYEECARNEFHLKKTIFNDIAEETGFLLAAIRTVIGHLELQNQKVTTDCIWIKACLRLYPNSKKS
ncbi:hypothetical protein [Maribacter sp. 2-571]|uniref:hypothetical protein n=1 Tax=Maribacter sp. 2-571 TaxID=3417569 RepID=UPI003D354947